MTLVNPVSEFIGVSGNYDIRVEAADQTGQIIAPIIRQQNVDVKSTGHLINPFEVVTPTPLISSMSDGKTLRCGNQHDIIFNTLRLGVLDRPRASAGHVPV